MKYLKRVSLFVITNLAILFVLSIVIRLLGVDHMLTREGINYQSLLIFAAVFGFGGSLISLAISKWMAKMTTGARVIVSPKNAREAWLLATVARLAQSAGIGMPEVAIFEGAPNAFATGARRDNALVAVSTGLLSTMNDAEVEAVIGHEIAHIANGDMVTLTLIQGVLNTFVIFASRVIGYFVDRVVFRSDNDRGGSGMGFFMVTMVMQMLLGILASMVVMWFSRQREFRADAGSAQLGGKENMIAALRRLGSFSGPTALPKQLNAFGIAGGSSGMMRLFMSHPPIAERIAALERFA